MPGAPVMTMVPDNGAWFGFNLREDALNGLSIGSVVPIHAVVQAEPISAKVVEMRNWGEFAAWRAARASGDHDLNTLFVRLDPVVPTGNLVAGQTSWITPRQGPGSISANRIRGKCYYCPGRRCSDSQGMGNVSHNGSVTAGAGAAGSPRPGFLGSPLDGTTR